MRSETKISTMRFFISFLIEFVTPNNYMSINLSNSCLQVRKINYFILILSSYHYLSLTDIVIILSTIRKQSLTNLFWKCILSGVKWPKEVIGHRVSFPYLLYLFDSLKRSLYRNTFRIKKNPKKLFSEKEHRLTIYILIIYLGPCNNYGQYY